ncbi:MAG: helix-turn-helix domain-containing protein [Oscillospiraceae bacterium]|nr:helix-turn-helix domain-containing protein [Oscillospiraceae bacterium]MDD7292169.1 helix-turn-helix domain-containing protein [Clostridiaceae bacterium]MDY5991055.1 helix-turn-helix domain-containing protein [Oscillospiraceae bacterium]
MNAYVTGQTIKMLREKKNMTQAKLAEMLSVSDKAISKWETGKGFPDITLLEPLSKALGVSVAELMNGNTINNKNKSANMLRSSFYVCPVCGNVITSTGNALVSCCGVTLSPLEAEEGEAEDGILIKRIENEHFVQIENPMTKEHYISFVSYVTSDRVQTVKLYPETDASCRFPVCGRGYIFYYCNRHGLMKFRV